MWQHMRAGVDERQPGHKRGHEDKLVRVQHDCAVVQRGHAGSGQQQHAARRAQRAPGAPLQRGPPHLPGGPPRVVQPCLRRGACPRPALVTVQSASLGLWRGCSIFCLVRTSSQPLVLQMWPCNAYLMADAWVPLLLSTSEPAAARLLKPLLLESPALPALSGAVAPCMACA